jgi:hypothetical protein
MPLVALAAAVLIVSGCNAAAPSVPAAPATPAKPAAPATPATPAVAKPTDPVPASAPKAAAPVDKTPLKADLSKIKFTATPEELFGWDDGESRAFFLTNGLGEVTVNVPADGEYEIVINASCNAAKGENAKFKLKVDGTQVGAETQLKSEDAKDYSFTASLKAGARKIGTEFTNDLYKEGEYDMNFYLHGVKVVPK